MSRTETLELECPVCGNNTTFTEKTVSVWSVGADGEREEKLSEATEIFCTCGEKVKTIDWGTK